MDKKGMQPGRSSVSSGTLRSREQELIELSRNPNRPRFVENCLAICPSPFCRFHSTDLKKCIACTSALGKYVKIIEDPYTTKQRVKMEKFLEPLPNIQSLPLSLEGASTTSATVSQAPSSPVSRPLPPPESSSPRKTEVMTSPCMDVVVRRSGPHQHQPVETNSQDDHSVGNPFLAILGLEPLNTNLDLSPSTSSAPVDGTRTTSVGKVDRNVSGNSASSRFQEIRLGQKQEKLIRIIYAIQEKEVSKAEKPVIFQAWNGSSDNYNSTFYTQIDLEDSIIEETRIHQKPHSIRILQLIPSAGQTIIQDQIYKINLQKVSLTCPVSLDFVMQMLKGLLNLALIQFEAKAFNLMEKETPWVLEHDQLEFPKIKSLEVAFDRSKYSEYSSQGKEIMEQKMFILLQIASTALPELRTCDISLPANMEAQLDAFLGVRPNLMNQGCKEKYFKDNVIRFYVESPNSTDINTFDDDRDPQPKKRCT